MDSSKLLPGLLIIIILVLYLIYLSCPSKSDKQNADQTNPRGVEQRVYNPPFRQKNHKISFIRPGLYLTDKVNARDYEELKNLGVKQILTIGKELEEHGQDQFDTMYINLDDHPGENIYTHFKAAHAFIDRAPTVVHCAMGISRSATLVISYLMKKEGLSLKQAVDVVRKARPIVNPNPGFMRQLLSFEAELNG